MIKPIQTHLPRQYKASFTETTEVPTSARHQLLFCSCRYRHNTKLSLIEQHYDTKNVFVNLAEIHSTMPLEIGVESAVPDLYWFYHLEGKDVHTMDDACGDTVLSIERGNYQVIYLPAGHYHYRMSKGHALIFYFVISKAVLFRYAKNSLRYLKPLLKRAEEGDPKASGGELMPITDEIRRHLFRLFKLPKLDPLLLEVKIPALALKLAFIAKQAALAAESNEQVGRAKLEEIRLTIKDVVLSGDTIRLSEIARHFRLQSKQLWLAHKRAYGQSVQQYITETRLDETYRLIEEERYSPTQAAHRMAYTDLNALRKLFKKRFGITLLELQKKTHTD